MTATKIERNVIFEKDKVIIESKVIEEMTTEKFEDVLQKKKNSLNELRRLRKSTYLRTTLKSPLKDGREKAELERFKRMLDKVGILQERDKAIEELPSLDDSLKLLEKEVRDLEQNQEVPK